MVDSRLLAQNEPRYVGSQSPVEVRQWPVEEVTAAPSRLGVVSTGAPCGEGPRLSGEDGRLGGAGSY